MTEAKKKIGRLLIIGGAEDPDESKMAILPHFVKMCGGKRARIVVCGSPSEDPKDKERKYRKLFEKLEVSEVVEASITKRHEAESEELAESARRATGVFFTGGDQLRLTSLVAGTLFGNTVRDRLWNDALVVAGTSAGAAAMGSTMVIRGKQDGSVRRSDLSLAPGLGYWRDALIDTHFAQRGRVSRVLTVFAQNPQVIGIGLDEDTAIEVVPGKHFTVVGQGAAFVFDGAVTHSNAPEVDYDEVIALTDSLVHVLPSGYGFDLPTKRPVTPEGEHIPQRTR